MRQVGGTASRLLVLGGLLLEPTAADSAEALHDSRSQEVASYRDESAHRFTRLKRSYKSPMHLSIISAGISGGTKPIYEFTTLEFRFSRLYFGAYARLGADRLRGYVAPVGLYQPLLVRRAGGGATTLRTGERRSSESGQMTLGILARGYLIGQHDAEGVPPRFVDLSLVYDRQWVSISCGYRKSAESEGSGVDIEGAYVGLSLGARSPYSTETTLSPWSETDMSRLRAHLEERSGADSSIAVSMSDGILIIEKQGVDGTDEASAKLDTGQLVTALIKSEDAKPLDGVRIKILGRIWFSGQIPAGRGFTWIRTNLITGTRVDVGPYRPSPARLTSASLYESSFSTADLNQLLSKNGSVADLVDSRIVSTVASIFPRALPGEE